MVRRHTVRHSHPSLCIPSLPSFAATSGSRRQHVPSALTDRPAARVCLQDAESVKNVELADRVVGADPGECARICPLPCPAVRRIEKRTIDWERSSLI